MIVCKISKIHDEQETKQRNVQSNLQIKINFIYLFTLPGKVPFGGDIEI